MTWSGEPDLTADDALAASALVARNCTVEAVPWDRPADWSACDAVVIRSAWNYHLCLSDFLNWVELVERSGARLFNDAATIRWNADKRYLLELQQNGVRIPGTTLIPRGSTASLSEILAAQGWSAAVVKPAVSANAHRTTLVNRGTLNLPQREFEGRLCAADVLVQEFVPEIQQEGELSLMFFDGVFSHAVRKRPQAGEFRVQEKHGGLVEPAHVAPELIAQLTLTLARWLQGSLYARVDGIPTARGFVLVELELIEPTLFFGWHPGAEQSFAAAVERRIGRVIARDGPHTATFTR